MDPMEFQPQVMGILGGLLQYLRGYKAFREWVYHVLAVAFASFGFVLFNPPPDLSDWRAFTIKYLVGVSGLLVSVWGGTFAASGAAKAGANFVPVTNSKP